MGEPATRGGAPPDALERALVAERPRLVGLAYRITGSRVDAEDVVQEAWERSRRVRADDIDRPAAWLTTVVSRLALDQLRAAQHRRETYVGPWLPEPVPTGPGPRLPGGAGVARSTMGATSSDPAELVELAESLTFGFLRLLEALAPVERVVFVLADVFGMPFPEVAVVVDRSPDACRQIASRARARVGDGGRRHQAPVDAARVADDLVAALAGGDTDRVLALLAPDVVLLSDGGPAVHAARRPVRGAQRVARLLVNLTKRGLAFGARLERTELNGEPGTLALVDDVVVYSSMVTVVDGHVTGIHTVVNPDKLAALDLDSPMV